MQSSSDAGKRDYISYLLTKGRETLEDAQLLLEKGHLHSAVNRVYYACFYSVSALLNAEGYYSKTHGGVLSLFDLHWAKQRRLPVSLAKYYRNLFKRRQDGDYGDLIVFDRSEVEEWLQEAQVFVETLSAEVTKILDSAEHPAN